MRPQPSILLFVAFLSFFLFSGASQATHDVEDELKSASKSDKSDEWKEFGCACTTLKGRVLPDVPFVSNLLGIPVTASSEDVQPEARVPPNSDKWPENLQQDLEALLFEEGGKIMRSFQAMINSTIALSMALHDVLESDNIPSDVPFAPLLKRVAAFVAIARDDFRAKFPLPATAPGHAERIKHVSELLELLQQLVFRLARNHEIEQEVIERHMARVRPYLQDIGVLVGDVAELYPAAIEALVLNMSAILLPEAVFLRSLVVLYCFGPYVLGKDAIGGWLLEHFSGVFGV